MKNLSLLRIQSLILVVLFSLVFSSCKKNQSEEPVPIGDVVIPKEVKVINSQTWDKNFQSLDSVSKTITFSKDITSTQSIQTGDILVSSAGEGLLRKVKSVTTVGNSIKVQTETATLTDAIDKGIIDFKQPLTVSQIKSVKYYYGGISPHNGNIGDLKQATQSWDINTVLYDNDKNPATTFDQIKLVGTFNCDWQLAGRIEIGLLDGLKEVKFGFESSENLDLQLIAGMQYSLEKSFKLATVYFTPFVVQVGVVPVVFTPQLDIYAGIEGYANGSITTGINQSVSFNTGMQYLKNQGWSPFTTLNKTLNFQPPTLNLNAGASAYIKPEITVKIYSVVGPYANLKLYERLDANILETPWWKLYAGIKMDGGAKVNILDKFLLECTISDLLKYEVMLSQSTTPPPKDLSLYSGNYTGTYSYTTKVPANAEQQSYNGNASTKLSTELIVDSNGNISNFNPFGNVILMSIGQDFQTAGYWQLPKISGTITIDGNISGKDERDNTFQNHNFIAEYSGKISENTITLNITETGPYYNHTNTAGVGLYIGDFTRNGTATLTKQ